MRVVIQRVSKASVSVAGKTIAQIGPGLLVLLGIAADDTESAVSFLAEKTVHLRIFDDGEGKMNRSILDMGGRMLIVSQFTLLADVRKGRRPSFVNAADPAKADKLYQRFANTVAERGVHVETGRFGEKMAVALVNDGPVTIILESPPPCG
jgi:D-aminoacyl-tRNA deacylase